MHRKIGKDRACDSGDIVTDRQTDRQTDKPTHRQTCSRQCFATAAAGEVTRSSAIAEGPRDAAGQLQSCQLLMHSCRKMAFQEACNWWRMTCLSSVLAGVSARLLDRPQSALNAAARLIFSARKSEHSSPLTPRTSVATCSGEDSISAVRSRVSLPPRHAQRHHTLLTVYAMLLMSTVAVISVLLTQSR